MDHTTCVILTAGNSERMGRPKPFLRFDSKYNFLEKIVTEYRSAGITEIVIVINETLNSEIQKQPSPYLNDCRFIINRHVEYGRFYSVKTGLKACEKAGYIFIQNVDNPFVDKRIIRQMISGVDDAEYYVPYYGKRGGHPVLLTGEIIKELIDCPGNDLNLRDWLSNYKHKKVAVDDEQVLININTPEDYERYFR